MKIVNLRGSLWKIGDAVIKKGDKEIKKHYLMTELEYPDENGEQKKSYSKIEIEDSFFKTEEVKEGDKKAKSGGLNTLIGIQDVLKPDTFDLDSIQYDGTTNAKRHRTWRIISAHTNATTSSNNGILLLGGFPIDQREKCERIFYDSRCSKGNVIAYSQTYSKDEEGKKIVNHVQFAALLMPGEMIAYHVQLENEMTKVIIFKNVVNESTGECGIIQRTKSPFAWKKLVQSGEYKNIK